MNRIAAVDSLDLRIANPLDCGVLQATQAKYVQLGKCLIDDPGVDLLLIQEHAPDERRGRSGAGLKSIAGTSAKPVVVMSEIAYSRTSYVEQFVAEAGVPFMHGIDRALVATGHLIAWAQAQRHRERATEPEARGTSGHDIRAPRGLHIGFDIQWPAGLYGLAAAGEALEHYGLPVVARRAARTLEEALAAAQALGYPVALKIESPDIAHKSDAGGVRLGLADAQDLRRAWTAMHADVARRAPAARVQGVLVARMAPPGIEMSVGVQRDPQFGFAIMVGLGGTWIEVLGDVSLRLLPVDQDEALSMIAELKAARLLGAFRGAPPRDVAALAAAMVCLSRLALDHARRLLSVEINPLIVHEQGRGASAVDARLVLS